MLLELDFIFGILIVLIYALFILASKQEAARPPLLPFGDGEGEKGRGIRNVINTYRQLCIVDVLLFTRLLPILYISGVYICEGYISIIDLSLTILTIIVMIGFNTVESTVLMVFAYIGSYFMIHSVDLLSFYISLEAQNFVLLILAGTSIQYSVKSTCPFSPKGREGKTDKGTLKSKSKSYSIESVLKFFMLSAFSSGVILYMFSLLYISTGLSMNAFNLADGLNIGIISALMFKLGAAPLHLWVIQIYSSVSKSLILFISTVPKLSLFGFLINNSAYFSYSPSGHETLGLFIVLSLITGSFSAYSVPTLRLLFAYSTVNEIGLLLLAYESSNTYGLYVYLGIYIISQILLWNMVDSRVFTILAISLGGLPIWAGFFGKLLVFTGAGISGNYLLLGCGLFTTVISLVYYLRIIRLFTGYSNSRNISTKVVNSSINTEHVILPSICLVLLTTIPFLLYL